MRHVFSMSLLALTCASLVGCARQDIVAEVEPMVGKPWPGAAAFSSYFPKMNRTDWLYFFEIARCGSDSLYNEAFCRSLEKLDGKARSELYQAGWFANSNYERVGIHGLRPDVDCACAKRKAALLWARCKFTYEFGSYYHLDGVSGVIYNVCYIASVPRKLIASLRSADGIVGYAWGVAQLLFGLVLAVVGCVASFVVNTACHPFETFSNLTVGFLYFNGDWISYVLHTNFLASALDLIWGGIIYPLLKALMFWS